MADGRKRHKRQQHKDSDILDFRTFCRVSFRFLGAELKQTTDETLFLELERRGYDPSSIHTYTENDDETTENAEIGKIG